MQISDAELERYAMLKYGNEAWLTHADKRFIKQYDQESERLARASATFCFLIITCLPLILVTHLIGYFVKTFRHGHDYGSHQFKYGLKELWAFLKDLT